MLFTLVILIPLKSLFWNDRFVWFVAQGNRRPSSNSPESSLHHSLQQWYETRWVTGEKLVKSTGSDQSFAFCWCFELSTFISNFELCMRERWTDENLQVLNGDGILRIWFCIGGVLGEWRVGPGLQSIHLPSTNFLRSFRVIWGSLHRIQVLWMRSVVVLMEELKPKPSQRRSERCDCHHQKKCLLTAK